MDEYHRELTAKNFGYLRPFVDDTPWDWHRRMLIDPFGNKLRLDEPYPRQMACGIPVACRTSKN